MKTSPSILISCVAVTIALGGGPPAAIALSPVEVQRIASKSTVRIKGCDFGSGAIVKKTGDVYTVLTAAHATRDRGCQVVTADDREYGVTQVKIAIENVDLAAIEFKSDRAYPVAKLTENSDRVESGENIYVSGFPVTDTISEPIFTFISGKVVGNGNKLQQRGYSLVYDNPTLPGHSGGPVWNERGEIVAIHGRGDVDTKIKSTESANVRIKTGFNLGITVNTFKRLAKAMGMLDFVPTTPRIATEPKLRPVDDSIASAVAKENKGDYRGILADMDRAIALDPRRDRLYYIRANAKAALNDRAGAIADYTQDIALNPRRASAYYNRANVRYKSGDFSQALTDYDRAIAIDPKQVAVYYNRANVKYRLQDYRGSIDDYSRAIGLDPKFLPAYSSRGWVAYQTGNDRAAIADFDIAIAMKHPLMAKIYTQKALAQYELGNINEAAATWGKALDLQPSNQDAAIALAIALYRLNRRDEALQLAAGAISLDKQLAKIEYLRTKNWRENILKDAIPLFQNSNMPR
jgi:tetratricopeptide (TPR) repeat protein